MRWICGITCMFHVFCNSLLGQVRNFSALFFIIHFIFLFSTLDVRNEKKRNSFFVENLLTICFIYKLELVGIADKAYHYNYHLLLFWMRCFNTLIHQDLCKALALNSLLLNLSIYLLCSFQIIIFFFFCE